MTGALDEDETLHGRGAYHVIGRLILVLFH